MASRARLSLPCPEATEPERPLTSLISELLEEIFLRVACPADLVRVSTARVSFRRLITGQSFLRRYRSIHPPQLLGFFRTPGFLPVEAPHPSAALAQSFARAADFSLDYLPGGAFERGRRHLADVRDGRVLLECPRVRDGRVVQQRLEYHRKHIVVWDPLSRRYLLLPGVADALLASVELLGSVELNELDTLRSGASLVPSGGIDDTSFSVVRWMQSDKRLGVSIFSSVSGRWSVSTSISCDALGLDRIDPLSGQCMSDCFYWKLIDASMLIKLDMNNMQFCTVDLPPGHEEREILIVESGGSKMAMFSMICEGTTVDYYTFSQNGSEESHEWHMERNIPLPARYITHCFIGTGPAEGFIFLEGIPEDEEDTQYSVFSIDIKSFNIERVIRMSPPAHTHPYFGPYMYPRMIQGYGEISSHPSEASVSNDSNGDYSSETPTRRSKVWEYFEPELVEVNGVMKAVCRYCGMKMTSGKSGTTSLRNHIKDSCQKINDDDRQRFIATFKKPSLGPFTFSNQRSRELMITWCIRADVAFNKFEDPTFAPWMASLQPAFSCIGHQTIRNDCVGMHRRMKQELRSELQFLNSHICFTSDLWTSVQKLGYICLTAHYVDADFVLHKRIISFKDVKYPHSGLAIEEAITKCLAEYAIKEKMFTITLDNAANNKTACDLLQESGKSDMLFGGEHIRVRCCVHILNILVQDGMAIANNTIEVTRDLIRYINSSPSRIQAFNEIAEREGLPAKAGLILDVPNRWNSTHAMILDALKYKIVLKRYATAQQQPFPLDNEWVKIEAIGQFLGAFEEATRAFSADRFPTSNLFLDNVLCIHQALKNPAWQVNQTIRDLAKAMDRKFDKYWEGGYNMTLVIASILDPRRKMDFLEFFYDKVCSSFIDSEAKFSLAKEWMTKYFNKYEENVRRNGTDPLSQTTTVTRGSVGSPVLGKRRMEQEFAQFRTQRRAARTQKSELDAYLEDEHVRDDEDFEILSWWKTNKNKYPILSAMARDFLAVPLSTVSSESAFSSSGEILGDNRSSMTPETLEALVCVKDWLYKYPVNDDRSVVAIA